MLVAMAFGVIPATAQTGSGTGSPALPATQPVVQDPAAAGGANAVDTADGEALSRKQKRKNCSSVQLSQEITATR